MEDRQDRPWKAPPINRPRPLLRRKRTWIAAATVAVIIAVVVFVWGPWRTTRVTDGGELFADHLARVQSLILAENNRVTGSDRPWVSIALMLPIRTTDDPRNNSQDVLRHLQGAYLAQYWANHPNGDDKFGNDVPLIRLLLADTGGDGQKWQDTVAKLADMAQPKSGEYLVAVAGLGLSTDATQRAANALAATGIPMVGTVITATGLAAPGLFRVAPTNSDEAAAMINYLRSTPDWQSASATAPYKAYLVQDRAEDDTYVEDL
ncbi:MAG: ABC transporter substrate-binding protein, partial [Gammaproteobacteria bacterium]